jgi:hypothetical protein
MTGVGSARESNLTGGNQVTIGTRITYLSVSRLLPSSSNP